MPENPTPTENPQTHTSKKWFTLPLAALFIVLFAYATYEARFKERFPHVAAGTPLPHTPKAQVKILGEADDTTKPNTTTTIVDVPFPTRTISATAPIAKAETEATEEIKETEEIAPTTATMADTAHLLQTTMALAKQHSELQMHTAKLHTLMGLILNPNLPEAEQQGWANLALPIAQKLQADGLATALQTLTQPQAETLAETTDTSPTTPTWLAPFQNLIQIKRTSAPDETPTHSQNLTQLRAAYQHYLINESY